jgi:hypothetical protein
MANHQRQHAIPMIIDRLDELGTARALEPVPLDSTEHKEKFIQQLIFDFPELLPMREVDSAFGSLVPICTEGPVRLR